MRDQQIGLIVRALRHRKRWRQEDCADQAGVHRSTWSKLERGQLDHLSLPAVRRCLDALDIRMELQVRWRGADLDRLLDATHSGVQAAWKARLESWEWVVEAEVSFNEYGDRGRVDLFAWHRVARVLLVVEIKTAIADVQGLIGSLDVKQRVAPVVARRLGWVTPSGRRPDVVRLLVVTDTSTNRRRIAVVEPLFRSFAARGKRAIRWLRQPSAASADLMVFSMLSSAPVKSVRRVRVASSVVRGSRASVDADQVMSQGRRQAVYRA